MGTLFDSPWKIAILAVLILVLFGAKKLPGAAKSLGQSMRILKAEVTKLSDDEEPAAPARPAAEISAPVDPRPAAAPAADGQQAQIDSLQQQIRDLQRAAAMDPVASAKKDD